MARSDYIPAGEMAHVLAALMPANRLAIEVSMATGLRIGDVLDMRTDKLSRRMGIRESKTGKYRTIYLPVELYDRLVAQAGKIYVFPGRCDQHRPRTRQAVWRDIKRAAGLFRLPSSLQISPHSARKIYAVGQYRRTGNIARVRELLNHGTEAVTMIYAMADALTERKLQSPGRKPQSPGKPR